MTDPIVKLAGKDYPVPPLVPRQQRIVVPALLRAAAAFKMLPPLPGQTEPRAVFDETKMNTAVYDDMVDIVYWGVVWPNDKAAKRDFVLDLNLPFDDLMVAINAVRLQTGLFKPAPEGATSGESKEA